MLKTNTKLKKIINYRSTSLALRPRGAPAYVVRKLSRILSFPVNLSMILTPISSRNPFCPSSENSIPNCNFQSRPQEGSNPRSLHSESHNQSTAPNRHIYICISLYKFNRLWLIWSIYTNHKGAAQLQIKSLYLGNFQVPNRCSEKLFDME